MTIPKLDIDKVLAYQQGKDKRAPPTSSTLLEQKSSF